MKSETWKKIRQVNGAGDVDVVVLFEDREDSTLFGYSVPVGADDDGTHTIYEAGSTEKEALEAGFEHLAVIEGCSTTEYHRRVAAGE